MDLAFLASMLWKSTAIAAVALILLRLLRSQGPAERSAVLRLAIAVLLALPLVAVAAPAVRIAVLPAEPATFALPAGEAAAAPAPRPAPVEAGRTWDDPEPLVAILYAGGVALVALRLAVGLLTLRRWTRAARPVTCPEWLAAFERLKARAPRARLLETIEVASPLSWGWRNPAILIDRDRIAHPGDAPAILAHEMAHVERRDWLVLMAMHLATAIFWFNPLVWLLEREVILAAEEAADAQALQDTEATHYAQMLLSYAEYALPRMPANCMAPEGGVARRVKAILAHSLGARRRRRWGWMAMLACLGVAAPISAAKLVAARGEAPKPRTSIASPQWAESARVPATAPVVPIAPVPVVRTVVPVPPAPAVVRRETVPAAPPPPVAPLAPVARVAPVAPAAPVVQASFDQEDARDVERDRREAQRDAEQARREARQAEREADADRAEALREAAVERSRAQREAQQARAEALREAAQARAEARRAADEAGRSARLASVDAGRINAQVARAVAVATADIGLSVGEAVASGMAGGADGMEAGARSMQDEARRLRDPSYRQTVIAENARHGSMVTDRQLLDAIPRMETGAARMREGAQRMREGQARMREGHTRMAEGAVRMERGADRMNDGAARMRQAAARLRDPGYRRVQIAAAAARGEPTTDDELQRQIPSLEDGAREMERGARQMREQARAMRQS